MNSKFIYQTLEFKILTLGSFSVKNKINSRQAINAIPSFSQHIIIKYKDVSFNYVTGFNLCKEFSSKQSASG